MFLLLAFFVEVGLVVDESTQNTTVDANQAIGDLTREFRDETLGQEDETQNNVSAELRMEVTGDIQPLAHQAPEIAESTLQCNVSSLGHEDGSREVVASEAEFEITAEPQSHTDQIGLLVHHAAEVSIQSSVNHPQENKSEPATGPSVFYGAKNQRARSMKRGAGVCSSGVDRQSPSLKKRRACRPAKYFD